MAFAQVIKEKLKPKNPPNSQFVPELLPLAYNPGRSASQGSAIGAIHPPEGRLRPASAGRAGCALLTARV